MSDKKMTADRGAVDANMVRLLAALNAIPGVDTFSSCGGHDDPGPGQAAKGHFTVNLDIRRDQVGWSAIAALQFAREHMEAGNEAHVGFAPWLNPHADKDGVFYLQFEIEGWGVHPDKLAEAIERVGKVRATKLGGADLAYAIEHV